MPFSSTRPSLRVIIAFDALTWAVMGATLLFAAEPIGTVTALPHGLLFYAGLSLVPIAAFMASSGRRRSHRAMGGIGRSRQHPVGR